GALIRDLGRQLRPPRLKEVYLATLAVGAWAGISPADRVGGCSERCGGLDAISLGPHIENLHSPDERLFIPSLAPTWDLMAALLMALR
ncbi:MAG: hypothetical protein NT121_22275, partial [Chloroflexi bacterium]|nr:hypothetical protein [Chloroflexota bacterium]